MFQIQCLFLTLLLLFSSYGMSKPEHPITEIIWLQSDTPPFHLNEQAGLCDNLTEQLISTIKNIKHTRLVAPQTRINKYINEGKNVCFPCVIYKQNTNSTFTYSNPTTLYPSFVIISSTEKADKLTKRHGNPINLVSLLADEEFTYGQAKARKFSPAINTIISNALTHQNVSLSWSSENESGTVFERIRRGFIDYSLDYPFMANYFNQQQHSVKMVNIPIAENTNSFIKGAVGCATSAPNDFANQAIAKINTALKNTILTSKSYQQNQQYWLNEYIDGFTSHYYRSVVDFQSQAIDAPINNADESKEPL